MSDEVETRTYEIVTTERTFRITVPASWKVTFGAVVPTTKSVGASSYGAAGWGLRFWEAADKQRAVYTNVVSFRDISIETLVAAVRKFGQASDQWFIDDGKYELGTVEKAWKPVDEVKERVPEVAADDDIPFRPARYASGKLRIGS